MYKVFHSHFLEISVLTLFVCCLLFALSLIEIRDDAIFSADYEATNCTLTSVDVTRVDVECWSGGTVSIANVPCIQATVVTPNYNKPVNFYSTRDKKMLAMKNGLNQVGL